MGEFSDLKARQGVVAQLRGLSKGAWFALGGVGLALVLLVAVLTVGRPEAATASPAPSYYVTGQQYYADTIPMPDYRSWPLGAAVADLARRGVVVTVADSSQSYALIQAQNPAPGTRIKQSTASAVQFMVPVTAPAPTTTTTTPPPTTTTTAPSASNGTTDVDVDVDTGHHDLPDGALTGGFCRKKWWC